MDPFTSILGTLAHVPIGVYTFIAKPVTDAFHGVYKKAKSADRAIDRVVKEYRVSNQAENANQIKRALLRWRNSTSCRELLKAASDTTSNMQLTESAYNSFIEVTGLTYSVGSVHSIELIGKFVDFLLAELRAQDPVRAQIELHAMLRDCSYQVSQSNVLGQTQDVLTTRLRIAPTDNIGNRDESEFKLHARIDTCKRHIENRQVSRAKKDLTALRNALLKNCSSYLRFRIATNLGICHLNSGEFELAEEEFKNALTLFPEHYLALANYANSAIFADNWPLALTLSKRAVELETDARFPMCIYLMALHGNDLKDTIAELLIEKPWIESDPLCLMALGQNAYDDKDFPLAESFYAGALELDPYDVQLHLLLAQSICSQVHIQLMANLPAMYRIPPEIEARITIAKDEIEKSLSLCKDDDHSASRNRVLTVRAAVHGMSNNMEAAHADCDLVLSSDPDNPAALANKASLLVSEDKFSDAKDLLDKLPDRMRQRTGALRGTVYTELGKYGEGIEAFREFLEHSDISDTMRIAAISGLIEACDKNGEPGKANKVIEDHSTEYSENAEFTYARALHAKHNSDRNGYMDLLRDAVSQAKDQVRDFLNRELARAYTDDGDRLFNSNKEAALIRYKMSVEVYERFIDKGSNTQETREYSVALANANRMSDAYDLTRMIRNDGPAIETLTDIEARYLEEHQRWEEAEAVLKLLVNAFPNSADFQNRLKEASKWVKLTIKLND